MKHIQTAAFGVPEYEMKGEGSTYRPPLLPEHLQRLQTLKRRTKRPITQLIADALEWYFEEIRKGVIKYELPEDNPGWQRHPRRQAADLEEG
jgi:hypothetical protein